MGDAEAASSARSTPPTPQQPQQVAIIGSGNWGTAIARIAGENVRRDAATFAREVRMWVHEETVSVDGAACRLTDVINTRHENVAYLPGHLLPDNVVALPDLTGVVAGAQLLLFVLPHQFLPRVLPAVRAALGDEALASGRVRALSLIKGVDCDPAGRLSLISDAIAAALSLPRCDVLMGANVAAEVAEGQFCEATVGTRGDPVAAGVWVALLQTRAFRLRVCPDAAAVELCGALKNVVALAVGFAAGAGYGTNTQAALVRAGLGEMLAFIRRFHEPAARAETLLLESCGVADVITSCFGGGRNARCAEAFVRTGQEWQQLEAELLGGQKLQGTLTCAQVARVLQQARAAPHEFPLFTATHAVMTRQRPPAALVEPPSSAE